MAKSHLHLLLQQLWTRGAGSYSPTGQVSELSYRGVKVMHGSGGAQALRLYLLPFLIPMA